MQGKDLGTAAKYTSTFNIYKTQRDLQTYCVPKQKTYKTIFELKYILNVIIIYKHIRTIYNICTIQYKN